LLTHYSDFYNESIGGKLWRRFREEPLIPLGCGLTAWAIFGATRSMRKGDHKKVNLYFRRRLYAQAFTIVALCAGNVYWQKDRVKRKDWEKLVKDKEAKEKRDRWLRELEARDEEEKAFKERLARRVSKGKEGDTSGVTEAVRQKTEELKERAQELKDKSFGSK
jgi:hypothetical protein